jgi:hypothetical protein
MRIGRGVYKGRRIGGASHKSLSARVAGDDDASCITVSEVSALDARFGW